MAPQKKGQKMALGDFLQDTSLGSWADEMEDMPMPPSSNRPGYGGDRSYNAAPSFGAGSGASFGDRGYSRREELPLPTKPPYTVHLGNMSFDATEGDIHDFFSACEVTSVRIVEDKMDRKPKGFGYVEFASLDGLKRALDFNGTQFQGRNIRVSVAEPQKDRPDAREFGDWTRKGPLPDAGDQRKVSDRSGYGSGPPRNFDNVSEAGSERGGRRALQDDGKVRDFGDWSRKGPLTPTLPTAKSFDRPMSRDGPLKDRHNSPSWGEGRSQEGSRPPRREFAERPAADRAPTASELDTQWRTKMRSNQPAPAAKSPALSNRELSNPPSPAGAPAALAAPAPPTTRPKLNLQKRTVSEAPSDAAASPAMSDSKASPFGAAKPIDSASKEKEITEKREVALKEKREAEEKAREETRVADDKASQEKKNERAARAERADRADREPTPPKGKLNGQHQKESKNGVTSPTAGKNYEILRRNADQDMAAADEEEPNEENADGTIVDDKGIKPQEVVRDMNNGATTVNGNQAAEPSADSLEDDGWSTVASKARPSKKGAKPAARAIAS